MTTNCHKLSEEKGTNCQPLQKCSCGSPVCSGGNSGFYLKQSFRLPAQYVLIGRFCAASASSLRSRSKFPAPLLSGSRVCATFHSTHVGVVHTAAALCIFFFLHVVFEKWDAAGPRADLLVTFLVCWPDRLGKSLLYWKTRSHYGREVPRVQVAAVSSAGGGRGKQLCPPLSEEHKVGISILPQVLLQHFPPNCSEEILHPPLLVSVHPA